MKAEDARRIAKKSRHRERLRKREYRQLMKSIKRGAKQGYNQMLCNFEFAENEEKLKLLGYEVTIEKYHRRFTRQVNW